MYVPQCIVIPMVDNQQSKHDHQPWPPILSMSMDGMDGGDEYDRLAMLSALLNSYGPLSKAKSL
jgi:hypothetical protein